MRLRWTLDAVADLERIDSYIAKDAPLAATAVVRAIIRQVTRLERFPRLGPLGRKKGTRELATPGLPYLAVYRLQDDSIEVLRILHRAQRWP